MPLFFKEQDMNSIPFTKKFYTFIIQDKIFSNFQPQLISFDP